MSTSLAALPPQIETIAELRELYRAAEARAARMRLLVTAGQELSVVDDATLDTVVQRCARRLALFLGFDQAEARRGGEGGIPVVAPGSDGRQVGSLTIPGLASETQIADPEDRETFRLFLELMGAAIDRIERERERSGLLLTLQEREQRLEQLVARVFTAQEEERRRVSRELHDGVAQTATALFRMLDGTGRTEQTLPVAERSRLAAIARDLVTELRRVIGGLRPTLLDDLGLRAALHTLADGLEQDGYTVERRIGSGAERLAPHAETAVFRVAQEAVSNIRKHAGGPCRVLIEFRSSSSSSPGTLRIADQGQGAVELARALSGSTGEHVGIDVMRERMSTIGGHLKWEAPASGGVTVTAYLPEGC